MNAVENLKAENCEGSITMKHIKTDPETQVQIIPQ